MAIPNRKDVIERVLAKYPHLLVVPRKGNEEYRIKFLPEFIKAMPPEDRGKWGLLKKTGSIPCDILVYMDTNEHFDVTTGAEIPGDKVHYRIQAVWKNHGDFRPKHPKWRAIPVEEGNIPPLPGAIEPEPDLPEPPPLPPLPPDPPPPVDPPPVAESDLAQFLSLHLLRLIAWAHELRDGVAARVK